ncbi:MAG: hypothetical protein IKR19_07930 [Acholeplasmatales bacterium]|nr:hypothetical protein [Acholeplasmatales bacterium]
MSLFGSYIQESTEEVLEESYYTEYDFLTESFNTAYDEIEQFHSFVTEKVDVKEAGKKFAAFIKGAIAKLKKMIQSLGQKIRELVGKIFNGSKEVKEAAVEAKKSTVKDKSVEMIKTTKVLSMSKALEMTIENVKGVDALSFYSKSKTNSVDDNANGAIMVKFKEIDTEDKAIVEETPGNLAAIGAAMEKSQARIDSVRGKLEAIMKDGKKAEAKATELEKLANDLQEVGIDQLGGDRTDNENVAQGEGKLAAAQSLRKDVALLSAYVGGCNKVAGYVSKIEHNLVQDALRVKAIAKNIGAKSKEATA